MNPQRHGLEIKDAIVKLLTLVEKDDWSEARFMADSISRELNTMEEIGASANSGGEIEPDVSAS